MLQTSHITADGPARQLDSYAITEGLVNSSPAALSIIKLGQVGGTRAGRFRGGVFIPVGQGAENAVFNFKLWAVDLMGAPRGVDQMLLTLLGSGSATMGATLGSGTLPIGSADRVCDTLTWTAAGADTLGTILLGKLSSASIEAVSPGSDGIAALVVSDMGAGYGAYFEIQSAGASILGRFYSRLHT